VRIVQIVKFDHFHGFETSQRAFAEQCAESIVLAKWSMKALPIFVVLETSSASLNQPSVSIQFAHFILTQTEGLVSVIRELAKDFKIVRCINLREEPVCYLNDKPYAPREVRTRNPNPNPNPNAKWQPFNFNINLEYLQGIEYLDLEKLESRIKADIRTKAVTEGSFSYIHQEPDRSNSIHSIDADTLSVLTVRELYFQVRDEFHLPIKYARVPITDELAPEVRVTITIATVHARTCARVHS
jgi:hypothetical protein